MNSSSVPPFESILKLCFQAGREPWYPGEFADSLGIPASRLAKPIEELKDAELVEPTPWNERRGPGYRLTRAGLEVLRSPTLMAGVRDGMLPRVQVEVEEIDPAAAKPAREVIHDALAGRARPYVAYAILAINLLMFAAGAYFALKGNANQGNLKIFLMAGDKDARHQTGAITSGDLMNNQWWRLAPSMFIHKDFFHLLIVMGAFMGFARPAEQLWGSTRFAAIYLISGFAGICLPLWRNPADMPVGAEGAVCGCLAAMVTWYVLNKPHMDHEVFSSGLRQSLFGFGYFIAWAAFLAFMNQPRMSWVGYAAGTVAGAIVAVGLNWQRFMDSPARWVFLVPVIVVPIACVGLLVRAKASPNWRAKAAEIKQKGEEQKKKRKRDDELDFFNEKLSPIIGKARRFFDKRWSSVEGLCDEQPEKRKKLEVAKAKDDLQEARNASDEALAAIAAAGEFEVERVTATLHAATEFLKEQKKLIDLAERCLDEGNDFPADDLKKLREQVEQTERSMIIYDKK